jgi:hypothetical protein
MKAWAGWYGVGDLSMRKMLLAVVGFVVGALLGYVFPAVAFPETSVDSAMSWILAAGVTLGAATLVLDKLRTHRGGD